jgi:hypothetical protein
MAMNKTKVIDGVEFSVAPFMAIEGARLKAYLVRTFGPAIGELIGALKGVLAKDGGFAADTQIDGIALARSIETLMSQLDEDSFIKLLKRMFANLIAKGKNKEGKGFARQFDDKNFEASFNHVFQGKLFAIYPVLFLVLEVNYPDFLSLGVRHFGKLTKLTSISEPGSETEIEESKNSEPPES